MAGQRARDGLFILEPAALIVIGHFDYGGVVREDDRAVLGVVGDLPEAGGGTDEGLVAVGVKEKRELTRRRGGAEDVGVLIEGVCEILCGLCVLCG